MKKISPRIVKRRVWDEPVSSESKHKTKTEKVFPKVTIPTDALPEAKSWKVGQKYTVTLELEMTGISIRERSGANEFDMSYDNRADFDIKGIEVKKGKKDVTVDRRYVDNDKDAG